MHNSRARGEAPRSARAFMLASLAAACLLLATAGWAAQAPTSKPDLLHQLSASWEALVRKVSPSVYKWW
jgi:hypothetical protein